MKKVIFFIAILGLFILNACGGKQLSEDGRTNENANSLQNGQKIPVQNANADIANAPSNSNINAPTGRVIVNLPADPNFKAKPLEVPAAYNSTVATTMDKQGKFIETRTFKSDPQILKVERRHENKTVKLYLKNGKAVDLPFDKVGNIFISGSPAELLQLAGIKPPATPSREDAPTKKQ